ncbi:MAG: ferrochelatase, partial [Ginsengibacter sp.]
MLANATKAVLLMNLGSPDSTNVPDVKKYLKQFLMDEKVIDKSWLVRSLLVKGIIVPFRAPKSAEAYKTIWTKDGSPLVVMTKRLQAALQQEIDYPVEIAMRYGNPSPETAFNNILKNYPQVTEVIAVPLYPHYAMSSFETAVDYAKEIHAKNNYSFNLDFVSPFYNNADYLNALAENTRPYLEEDYDHILFSYHGVPARHIMKSDVTGNHCLQSPDCCST